MDLQTAHESRLNIHLLAFNDFKDLVQFEVTCNDDEKALLRSSVPFQRFIRGLKVEMVLLLAFLYASGNEEHHSYHKLLHRLRLSKAPVISQRLSALKLDELQHRIEQEGALKQLFSDRNERVGHLPKGSTIQSLALPIDYKYYEGLFRLSEEILQAIASVYFETQQHMEWPEWQSTTRIMSHQLSYVKLIQDQWRNRHTQ
ncbi:MAG: hypothetical protein IPG69_19095 [Flavobacteriales bacterium]|nr:hypothetical protein [Flavobacteriales bacterium]MBK9076906.1 hypothetical protein [Flavobacteriales bacterium]MBK9538326.1 hypothetical protein [Flavobacteriales bacterium]